MTASSSLLPAVSCTPDTLPADLRAWPQWVVWKNLPNGDKKPRKVLHDPKTGRRARTANADGETYTDTAASTWGTFAQAVTAYQAGGWAGIGFVFTAEDPFIGGDIDDCRNPDTGALTPDAERALRIANTYAEVSQSGKGIKFIGRAKKRGGRSKNDALNVEMYDNGRFFALTGCRLPDTPATVEERQLEFDALYLAWFPEKETPKCPPADTLEPKTPANVSDVDLITHIRRSAQGAKFEALWRGDTSGHNNNPSGADLALCCILAWWTDHDATRIDSLFRSSGLMRPKWDEKRGAQTYGQNTVDKALRSERRQDRQAAQREALPVTVPVLASDEAISLEAWQAHGQRLHDWKSAHDEQFRYAVGKWYACAQIEHGEKERYTRKKFGNELYHNIRKWASAVTAWGNAWQDGLPMWLHQELQAQPLERRLEIATEYRQGGMGREDVRAAIGHVAQPKPATDWQAARKCFEKDFAQELVDAGNLLGYAEVQHQMRRQLQWMLAKHQAQEQKQIAPYLPTAEAPALPDAPANEENPEARAMVEAAFEKQQAEQDAQEQEEINAQRWRDLGIEPTQEAPKCPPAEGLDAPEPELLPVADEAADESPPPLRALSVSVYTHSGLNGEPPDILEKAASFAVVRAYERQDTAPVSLCPAALRE